VNFVQDVKHTDAAQSWRRTTIRLKQGNTDFEHEHFEVGDESGVQSRFTQHYAEELSRIFEAQQLDMNFSDFKCLGLPYVNTPDVVLKSTQGELKIVGEIKVPWIKAHKPSLACTRDPVLRHLLAQPIQYMQHLRCAYGFYTTYDETVFLRQVSVNGVWEIEYSPVVFGEAIYQETSPSNVSAKQVFCILLLSLALKGHLSMMFLIPDGSILIEL
jgi:hypothetical protein